MKYEGMIHEDRPHLSFWVKLLIFGILVITVFLGINLFTTDINTAGLMIVVAIVDLLLFYLIIPRKYQIYPDRLVIILGWPFKMKIPLSCIRTAKPSAIRNVLFYRGVRLVTDNKSTVEITRENGNNILLSPRNQELFLDKLKKAVKKLH
jgi:hypothetical protein